MSVSGVVFRFLSNETIETKTETISQDSGHETGTDKRQSSDGSTQAVAHTAQVADGVANGGGLCSRTNGTGGGVPVAGDREEPVVSTEA